MLRPTAALVLVALAVGGCGGSESAVERTARARADQARGVARRAGLSREVQDLLARYAASVAERFAVTYAPSQGGATIVLTQRPPDRRVDLVRSPVTQSLFETAKGSFECILQNKAWACTRTSAQAASVGPLSTDDIDRTVKALEAARGSYTFRVVRRRLVGVEATCLETTSTAASGGGAGPTSLCLSPQGAPLLVTTQGTELRATRYSTTVDDRRLRLPATPRPATTGAG